MTIRKFKLQKRARMLKQLTKKAKRHKSSVFVEEEPSIGRDSSMGDHSIGTQDEDEDVGEEEESKKEIFTSSEKVVSSKDDGETTQNENTKIVDNSELIRSIRNIIQVELQPLKRDLRKLKKTVRSSVAYDEEDSNSKGDYEALASRLSSAGTGLHQRTRRNSMLEN